MTTLNRLTSPQKDEKKNRHASLSRPVTTEPLLGTTAKPTSALGSASKLVTLPVAQLQMSPGGQKQSSQATLNRGMNGLQLASNSSQPLQANPGVTKAG